MVFEKLKRLTSTTDRPAGEYQCQACNAGFEVQRQVCPECGGYHIDRMDW